MDDRAYRNAVKRRDELQRELETVNTFIRLYRQFSGTDGEHKAGANTSHDSTLVERPTISRMGVAKYAREFMIERGSPMTRGELVDKFDEFGLPVGGTDKSKNMGTIMWRLRDEFVNLEGHGYWPRDIPCPRIGYDPSVEIDSDNS
ncbi:MAG: hypothetical protein H6907_05100 [Hyphomicrobiales bacterium]|nr:hypothetical protein [Hyphomicrobiales bacterium]